LFDDWEEVRGVLDADSDRPEAFDALDREHLEKVGNLIRPLWPAR
jgi:putative methionine-R-sulfoxide reductase with GAF domain